MRLAILSLGLLAFSLGALAQSPSSTIRERAAVLHAKNLLVSSLDSRLPRISLEYFLAYEAEGVPGKWAIVKCDNQSKQPNVSPVLCVKTDFELKNGNYLTLVIELEGTQNGKFTGEKMVRVTVNNPTGEVRQVQNLGDLPMALHRRPSKAGSRPPRDLPPPARDS